MLKDLRLFEIMGEDEDYDFVPSCFFPIVMCHVTMNVTQEVYGKTLWN